MQMKDFYLMQTILVYCKTEKELLLLVRKKI